MFSALAAASILIGGHVGNGGNVLVCRDAAGNTADFMLYDYYEAQLLRPELVHDLGAPTLSVDDKVALALRRWSRLEPRRAALYTQWAREFQGDVLFIHGQTLPTIPDTEPVVNPPPGCEMKQIAIHREPMFPGDTRYFVDGDLYDSRSMTNDAKAGLILHEVIYREAVTFGVENSIGVRYLNALAASTNIDSVSSQEFVTDLRATGMGTAEASGVVIDLKGREPQFSAPNQLKFADIIADQPYRTFWGQARLRCWVEFGDGGELQKFTLTNNSSLHLSLYGYDLWLGASKPDGASCDLDKPDEMIVGDTAHIHLLPDTYLNVVGANYDVFGDGFADFANRKLVSIEQSDGEEGSIGHVTIAGTDCPARPGHLLVDTDGVLREVTVRHCRITVASNQLDISGDVSFNGETEPYPFSVVLTKENQSLRIGRGGVTVLFKDAPTEAPADVERGTITFLPSGHVGSGTLAEDTTLLFADQSVKDVLADTWVAFEEDGAVTKTYPRSKK